MRANDIGGKYKMLAIRAAQIADFNEVQNFYNSIIDNMQNSRFKPGWEKGIYPTERFLNDAINNQELFIGALDGEFTSAMVINHEHAEGYEKAKWNIMATKEEIAIIYALGISPT